MQYSSEKSRKNMVDGTLRPSQVTQDKVISAFLTVPREVFISKHLQNVAYIDDNVEVSKDRFLLNPVILARMIQSANVQESDLVLDVFCATGYSTAILSHISTTVVGIDQDSDMIGQAAKNMQSLGIAHTVFSAQSDMSQGFLKQSPYNVIVVNGAVDHVPKAYFDQLADGGRLVTVISDEKPRAMHHAMLFRKNNGVITQQILFDCRAPVVAFEAVKKDFVF